MVKALMKVITKNHNTGCYSPPPLKERKEGQGTQGNDEEWLDVEKRKVFPLSYAAPLFDDRSISPYDLLDLVIWSKTLERRDPLDSMPSSNCPFPK
jgi:hypothetical protein